jgi:putative ABC transport system ATP-binding protein
MTLLELEHVSKRYRHGAREIVALRDVSLELHAGEVVTVWGMRGSGRSTLLRVAAGVEAPDSGSVRVNGRRLCGGIAPELAFCRRGSHGFERAPVLDELIAAQLAQGLQADGARERALAALERVDARRCGELRPHELDSGDAVRVSIARALVRAPSLLLIDEPTTNVDLRSRDRIVSLLRSLAQEGIAVLASVGGGTDLFGADRTLAISDGALSGHAAPELAEVVEFSLHARG